MSIRNLVKGMKPTDKLLIRMVNTVFKDLKAEKTIIFKADEEQVVARALQLIKQEYEKEQALDAEVNRMMDKLERDNPGEFQRFKMFPLLKKKLAKDKKVIL